jgi:CyaY protein
MSDAEFSTRYEETLIAIEDAVENSGADLDYETVNDILTLTCPDGSSIIITRQSATRQLWLAAKSGGFHFDMTTEGWVCDSDRESLIHKLTNIFREQAGVDINFSDMAS